MTRRDLFKGLLSSTALRLAPFGALSMIPGQRLVGRFQGTSGRVYQLFMHARLAPDALWQGYYLTRVNGTDVVAARVDRLGRIAWTREEFTQFGRDSIEIALAWAPKARSAWMHVDEFGSYLLRLRGRV